MMTYPRPPLGPRPGQGQPYQAPSASSQPASQPAVYVTGGAPAPFTQQYHSQLSQGPLPPTQQPPHVSASHSPNAPPPQTMTGGYHTGHQHPHYPHYSHSQPHSSTGYAQYAAAAPPPPPPPHTHAPPPPPPHTHAPAREAVVSARPHGAGWVPVADTAYGPSSQMPQGYGASPSTNVQVSAPHMPHFTGSAPAMGYVQPPNAPAAVYGTAAGAARQSQFRPTGRKKALLVGINYSGPERLDGCINDVRCMQYLLATRFGFPAQDTTVLTDKACKISGVVTGLPTRWNILESMRQLVAGARPGDSLFFHFSGHGGQVKDTSGDEVDGMDETLIPMDWRTAGHILDDECYDILVRPLPAGVRLTAVLDACHSGTGLDLPYQHDVLYTGSGMTVAGTAASSKPSIAGGFADLAGALVSGKPSTAVQPFFKIVASQVAPSRRRKRSAPKVPKPDWNAGEVLLFAGCADNQTSADTARLSGGRTVTGAMTYALIEAIEHSTVGEWQNYSYKKLLHTMRQKLVAARLSQTPQFSSSHPFDLESRFVL